MTDTTLSPRLRHLLIREDTQGRLVLPDPRIGGLPPILPRPAVGIDRRGSDITRLLNISPPPTRVARPSPPRPATAYPSAPMTAPIDRAQHMHDARPDMARRHSSNPYEINPVTNRIVYKEFDFSPIGSRAPISRTTKACNACRARKVRCDAGGGPAGAEPGTCSRCREAGVDCVYSGIQKKRGPCPGTTRPSLAQRRRTSQKSLTGDSPNLPPTVPPVPPMTSKSSIQSLSISTPPDMSPPRTARSSYGFPPPQMYQGPAIRTAPGPTPADWARMHKQPTSAPAQRTAYDHGPFDHRGAEYGYPPRPAERMFSADYTMAADNRIMERRESEARRGEEVGPFGSGRNLPPLRVAVTTPQFAPGR